MRACARVRACVHRVRVRARARARARACREEIVAQRILLERLGMEQMDKTGGQLPIRD